MNMQNPLLFFILFLAEMVSAQPTIEWQKSLGGSYFDEAKSIQQTRDGGFIVAADVTSVNGDVFGNHGGDDFWLLKFDIFGSLQWKKTYGGSANDIPYSIQQTSDNGYIVAGFTDSNNWDVSGSNGEREMWVLKLSESGVIQWQKCYGGSLWEHALSIQQTSDEGFVFTGYAESNDGDVTGLNGDFDVWVVKVDHLGVIEWQKTFGGTGEEWGSHVIQTNDGGYIVAGKTSSVNGDVSNSWGGEDFWVLKLDDTGKLLWEKTYGGNGAESAEEIWPTQDGGFVVVGYITQSSVGQVTNFYGGVFDAWVIKINAAGDLLWEKTIGGSGKDYGRSIHPTTDGGFIVTGETQSTDYDILDNDGGQDAFLVKLNSEGVIQWQKTIGGTMAEYGSNIRQTTDGGFIFAGSNWSSDGDATSNKGYTDVWIVKLSPESTATTDHHVQVLTVFPNPSTGLVTLQIPPEETIFKTQLIDLQGRIVHEENGSNTTFDLSPFPKGSYLLSVRSENGQMWVGKIQKK